MAEHRRPSCAALVGSARLAPSALCMFVASPRVFEILYLARAGHIVRYIVRSARRRAMAWLKPKPGPNPYA